MLFTRCGTYFDYVKFSRVNATKALSDCISYFCVLFCGEFTSQFHHEAHSAWALANALRAICTHLTALVYASWD